MDTLQVKDKITKQSGIQGPAGFLQIDDGGTGDIPVLFVHSYGGSTQHWSNQLEHLRKNRRAIAFDSRGHGLSAPSADNDYAIVSLAEDIAAVADSLELKRFILVGHSQGGSAAIAYAGKYPDRVAALVVAGTPGKTPPEQAEPIIKALKSDAYQKVMDDYFKQQLADAKPEVDKLEREGMNKIPRETSVKLIEALFEFDPLPNLRSYPGPKLIVGIPREDQPNSLHKSFPTIPYKSIEGASHWMHMDKPEEFNRILDDFLKTVKAE